MNSPEESTQPVAPHLGRDESASRTVVPRQAVVVLLVLAAVAGAMMRWPFASLLAINALLTIFYLAFTLYKFALISLSGSGQREIRVSRDEIESLHPDQLPVYTILVPLYREKEVLRELLAALDRLDYPKEKLDVLLLLEADDTETVSLARQCVGEPHIAILEVPPSLPRTKPKACNAGLEKARGELLVIYDAEDRPEPDQLKKAATAFRKVPEYVVCLQAKLNFYNSRQNLLTRWFTTEYSMWFDLYLPGLGDCDAPIPLGGTSNHFRTDVLRRLGAWDPYNVTEDCDLGMRLYRRGFRTRILDSTTWEEACSSLSNWTRQRSRWVKGYIQTYLVHLRHPWALLRALGPANFLHFQLTIGGMFFSFLVNPFYWALTAIWFFTRARMISVFFPPPVFFLSALCLFIGNFVFVYLCALGAYRRRYFDLVKYALLIPPYWLLISLAAWKGFLQLLIRPFYWEKTRHGQTPKSGGTGAA